jgi:predicted adenylyl cyclase CyaB
MARNVEIKARIDDPAACVARAAALANGLAGRVKKHRKLFLVGRTRIHIDEVEHLGHFLELEVVLADDEPLEVGVSEAHGLIKRLGILPHQLVEEAYVDLLALTGLSEAAVAAVAAVAAMASGPPGPAAASGPSGRSGPGP